jgi:hypothetical protein
MNLRSKSTEIYLSASVSHYRGPFILVGADAPVGLPYATQLSYLRTAVLLLNFEKKAKSISGGCRASR